MNSNSNSNSNSMAPRKRERCSHSQSQSGWSSIPELLLDLILSKLTSSLSDCLALGATCSHWRSSAKQFRINANLLMPITIAAPNNHQTIDDTFSSARFFHDLTTSNHFHLHLPAIRGFTVFGSRFGRLIAFRPRDKFLNSKIMLFHPLSTASIPLPNPPTDSLLVNALLTAAPEDPHCTVVLEYGPGKLAFARPRHDVVWHRLNTGFYVCGFLCLNKTFLYCLRWLHHSDSYSILKYDMSFHPPPAPAPPLIAPPPQLMSHQEEDVSMTYDLHHRVPTPTDMTWHLLEIQSQLCVLVKFFTFWVDSFIEIFRLETDTQEWTRVESLGNSCLVMQDKVNLSLVDAAHDPKLIPGCIYYPNTNCINGDHNKLIYYPSTRIYGGTQIWTRSQHFTQTCKPYIGQPPTVPFELHDDVYSKIYPSILLHLDSFM